MEKVIIPRTVLVPSPSFFDIEYTSSFCPEDYGFRDSDLLSDPEAQYLSILENPEAFLDELVSPLLSVRPEDIDEYPDILRDWSVDLYIALSIR